MWFCIYDAKSTRIKQRPNHRKIVFHSKNLWKCGKVPYSATGNQLKCGKLSIFQFLFKNYPHYPIMLGIKKRFD